MNNRKLAETKLDWETNWDSAIGLWRQQGPGHCKSVSECAQVHSGPEATMRLLVAAQAECLQEIDVSSVLAALRKMQILDGGQQHGAFRWYLEEPILADDHAVFFNGPPLLVLWALYRNELDNACRELLSEMLIDSCRYCRLRIKAAAVYYPNEFLGYLLCASLAAEYFQLAGFRDDILKSVNEAADYLTEHGWGWGEHLSDTYAIICVEELSLLLLLSKELPEKLRAKIEGLLQELVELDDFFVGGPTVPSVRNYTFTQIPVGLYCRDHICLLPQDATFAPDDCLGKRLATCSEPLKTAAGGTWMPLGHTLAELGWHKLVQKKKPLPPRRSRTIPCIDGASAVAYIDHDTRLGSLSRFPLMPTAECSTWGLSWQCFPVTLWQREKVWGFLQWETLEAGQRQCHPAQEKYQACLKNALTYAVQPPIVGQTYSRQQEGELLALRIMPAIAATWDELADRFRIIGTRTKVIHESSDGNWSQLVLDWGTHQIALQCLRLSGGPEPAQTKVSDEILDWSVRCGKKDLVNRRDLVDLWGISLSGPVRKAPVILPAPRTDAMPYALDLLVKWEWPNCTWNLRINPRALFGSLRRLGELARDIHHCGLDGTLREGIL